jgi:formylglycine-generating enzyme required for sulfatase activity
MPVEGISWADCQALIQKLNERVPGGGFRLPTEEEWEYAARAGSVEPFQTRDLAGVAWFRENAGRQPAAEGASLASSAYAPRPVGAKASNRWGLYDMQGNVWEWTSSAFLPYARPAAGPESPTATALRVLRGGGFIDSAETLDYALRHADRPDSRFRWNGLRLARSVPGRQAASR